MKLKLQLAVVAMALLTPLCSEAQLFRTVGMAPVKGMRKVVPGVNKDNAHKQIEILEEQWRQAQLKADTDTLSSMLSDDFIGINANGMVLTRSQWIDRTSNRKMNVIRMDVDDQKIKIINGNTAIVTSQVDADGEMDGRPLRGKYLYTRVYAKQSSGVWKIVNFEATRIRPGLQRAAERDR